MLEIRTRQQEDIISKDLLSEAQLLYWKTSLVNDISIRSTQADLSSAWGRNKLGAGAKFAYSNTYNDSRYDTLTHDRGFVPDESRNFLFRYQEYISAAYISWSNTIKRFTYSASIRVENTRTIADAPKIGETTKRDLWHWLPSASIHFLIDENDQIQLNFSRRLTRPVFSDLYPFRIYNSPLNYFTGNPYLTPAVTTALNLSWAHGPFNASFYIGRENDPLGRYPKYDPVTNILEYLGKNFDHRSFANLEISWPIEVTKWWRMSNTVGWYYTKEYIPYFEYNFAVPVRYLTLNGSQVFTLPGKLTLDLSYYYKSVNGNSLYTSRPNSNIDIGLQRNWWKGKLNSKLSVHDIFNSYKIIYIFREKQLINNTLSHWPGMRRVALTLSYNFGASTFKAKQQSRSEEEGRAM
ncbi:MAG: TonB-dependent receptor family protein [Chitinophagaceae bacterium]|nr:TonB-dependent receptor family protein [Chitinophagaceae bacterium]